MNAYMKQSEVNNWKQFSRIIRSKRNNLLSSIENFPCSVLITGCQRSGTTMLSRIISKSSEMENYWFGKDDELAAALILSGAVPYEAERRCCFQTTYLNDRYHEYLGIGKEHKVVWVLRNPYSVVYSMVYNWRRWALNELFNACGLSYLTEKEKKMHSMLGSLGFTRLKKACYSYNGKIAQLEILNKSLNNLCVVDYNDLVTNKNVLLKKIYGFLGIEFKSYYSDLIHNKSMNKEKLLNRTEAAAVKKICMPIYLKSKNYVTINSMSLT